MEDQVGDFLKQLAAKLELVLLVLYEISISINTIGANFQTIPVICKNQENNLGLSPQDSVFLDSGRRNLIYFRAIYLQSF